MTKINEVVNLNNETNSKQAKTHFEKGFIGDAIFVFEFRVFKKFSERRAGTTYENTNH